MADNVEEFNLRYSSANKDAVIKEIQTTMTSLEESYKSLLESWEIIKEKFTLDPKIKNELDAIGSINGDQNLATMEFKKIKTNMDNLIESLNTVNTSWAGVSNQIADAVHKFGVNDNTPGGHNVE